MNPLIDALGDPRCYPHRVDRIEVIETHISWVLLTGCYAYKIKKPVALEFLDFSSLAARHHYCEEELRLNRRLAPQIYLDLVNITGSTDRPRIGGTGAAIEHAVKMRQFEQDKLFSQLLQRDALTPELVERLAVRIAGFHADAAIAPADSTFGMPETILQPALDNFTQMATQAPDARKAALEELHAWTEDAFRCLEPAFAARRSAGFVRECHGDLHLRNIALIEDEPIPFDCIEFSADLRWIDVMSEAAFLVMDFIDRARADLGFRFLNAYLDITGDYDGVTILRFYLVYRALVRAKIHALRAQQASSDAREAARLDAAADGYIELAQRLARNTRPALVLMRGFSGSGKSTVAAALIEAMGAIRGRSDVERKRLFGLHADARSESAVDSGIYHSEASERTYRRLREIAETALNAGYMVILDAAFLKRRQRDMLATLAAKLDVPKVIVDCDAAPATLRQRIATRQARSGNPSEATLAVLERQLSSHDELGADEAAAVVRCDMNGEQTSDVKLCVNRVARHLNGTQDTAMG